MKTALLAVLLLNSAAFAAKESKSFGKALTLSKPVTLADAMTGYGDKPGEDILVEGKVAKVCQKKGCWMILSDGQTDIRITFKGYAFFVPKGSAGKDVRAQGVLKAEELSVKLARHYLKDEGASKEEIAKVKAPSKTWSFVASGIEFL